MASRIVISGMGVVTPIGGSVESFWDANLQGKSGLRLEDRMDLSALPCGWVAATVPDETKKTIKARWGESNRAWGDILMHAAVSQALDDAAFEGGLTRPAGLVWARVWPGPSGSFPQDYVEFMKTTGERYRAVGNEPGDVIAYLRAKQDTEPLEASDLSAFPTELSGRLGVPLIAARLDATCAGGLRAMIEAARLLVTGKVDFAVVAAVVSRSNHYTLSQYAQLMALSRWKNPPEQACMPFDKRRSGMIINESSGAMVLETAEHARARGIEGVHAEIGGWGLAVDTDHLTAPNIGMVERVMRMALEHAGLTPDDIDSVNAHGTSTRLNDVTEAKALHRVFGERMKSLDVCAVKSLTGHGSAASGILESVVAALTMCRGVIPPVVTCTQPDPECNVKTSLTPVRRPVATVLKNSFGFGGQYASMVFKRPGESTPATVGVVMNERPKEAEAGTPSVFQSVKSSMPLVWEVVRPRRGRLALGLALLLVSRAAGLVVPYAPKLVIDTVIAKAQYDLLPPLFAALLFSLLIQAGTGYALTQLLSLEGQRLVTEMRRRVQAHIGRLPVAFFDTNKTGVLVTRVMNDVSGIRNLVGQGCVELVGSIVTAALVLIILLHISVMLTLVTVGFLAVLSGFLTWAFRAIRPMFRESARIASEVSGRLVETFGGIRVVKGYRAEAREEQVFAAGAQRLLDNANKTITLGSVMGTVSVLDVRLLSAVILCLGAQQALANEITVGSLFSFLMYLSIVIAPITQMASVGTQLADALAGLDRTREILAERPEDLDPDRTTPMQSVIGHVEFQGVSFEYQPGKPILSEVSFEARPGTVTALVGSSGSGKSTITGLIAAFYKPSHGKVLVDGTDLSRVRLDTFRAALGIVPQESFLFDGTIRENILFSCANATEEEFQRACHIAHVDEFANRFAEKYATTIGERGVRLSGGQRQRISIARAILADPRILILDEATSNLDSESEAFIQDGLRYLMRGRTTFVIAHRLSTARQADQILVVERGRIVERGTHASLYAQKTRYFQLYSRQHDLHANTFEHPEEGDATTRARRRGIAVAEAAGSDDNEQRTLSELL